MTIDLGYPAVHILKIPEFWLFVIFMILTALVLKEIIW